MVLKVLEGGKRSTKVHPDADINDADGFLTVGSGAEVRKNAGIDCSRGGIINIGANTVIFPHALLLAHGGEITIGEFCTVNPFCVLYGHGGLKIGNYVRIATHSIFIPANHVFDDIYTPITKQGLTKKGIVIEDDVWISAGVRVLDGVTIGKGAVVGAGAVVNKDVEPYIVVGGVPAVKIGVRGKEST